MTTNGTAVATIFGEGDEAVAIATGGVGDFTITATWHGGPYIDLSMDGGATAYDVLNVWDYETDKARIPFTADVLAVELAAYLGTEGLLQDLGNFAY